MGQLGFDVHAAPAVVRNIHDYGRIMHTSDRFGEPPDVFLVVTMGEETDPMYPNEVPAMGDTDLRPQLTMVRGIPWLAFRHLRGTSSEVNVQYLVDVWNYSFRNARTCFQKLRMKKWQVHIDVAGQDPDGVFEHHKSLLAGFSPNFYRICGPAMRQFVPISSRSPGWDPGELMERLRVLQSEDMAFAANDIVTDNCHVLIAIILGTIYGFCSKVCLEDGRTVDEDSEIAFSPNAIYDGERIKRWASYVGYTLTAQGFACDLWTEFLFELFLAHPKLAEQRTNYANKQNPNPRHFLLGAQANGMTAVSDLLVNLTVQLEARGYFHIKKGQVINLPLTEEGYILASSNLETPLDLTLDPEPENTTLYRFDSSLDKNAIRIDVEPCWEADPRTVIFRVREMGEIIAPLNIMVVLDRVAYNTIECSCSKHMDEVTVPLAERWQHVRLHQLKRTLFKGMSIKRADLTGANNKILIDASGSESATIYALGIVHTRQLGIATDCLDCAYKDAVRNEPTFNQGAVIIIPWKERP
jgi:hypothetical protein